MTRSDEPQGWILRSRALLQQSADGMDGATRSRLSRARHAALAPLQAASAGPRWIQRFGVGATVLGLAVLAWRLLGPVVVPDVGDPPRAARAPTVQPMVEAEPAIAASPAAAMEAAAAAVAEPDFELLADAESFTLLEDLEFYAWLEHGEGQDG